MLNKVCIAQRLQPCFTVNPATSYRSFSHIHSSASHMPTHTPSPYREPKQAHKHTHKQTHTNTHKKHIHHNTAGMEAPERLHTSRNQRHGHAICGVSREAGSIKDSFAGGKLVGLQSLATSFRDVCDTWLLSTVPKSAPVAHNSCTNSCPSCPSKRLTRNLCINKCILTKS